MTSNLKKIGVLGIALVVGCLSIIGCYENGKTLAKMFVKKSEMK